MSIFHLEERQQDPFTPVFCQRMDNYSHTPRDQENCTNTYVFMCCICDVGTLDKRLYSKVLSSGSPVYWTQGGKGAESKQNTFYPYIYNLKIIKTMIVTFLVDEHE